MVVASVRQPGDYSESLFPLEVYQNRFNCNYASLPVLLNRITIICSRIDITMLISDFKSWIKGRQWMMKHERECHLKKRPNAKLFFKTDEANHGMWTYGASIIRSIAKGYSRVIWFGMRSDSSEIWMLWKRDSERSPVLGQCEVNLSGTSTWAIRLSVL